MTNLPRAAQATTPRTSDDVQWDAIYWEQLPRIYNFLRYRVGNADAAEDLTALTFVKAWQARGQYQQNLSGFSTWLFVIARNVATDFLRQRRDDVPLDSLAELSATFNIEDVVEHNTTLERLSAMLGHLTPRERELISLKYGSELTNRAIADIVGLSESNVGTILHRAIQKLRQYWDDER